MLQALQTRLLRCVGHTAHLTTRLINTTTIPGPQESFAAGVQAELNDLRAALTAAQTAASDAEAQSNKLNDQFLRLTADFDNFRKRTVRQQPPTTDELLFYERLCGVKCSTQWENNKHIMTGFGEASTRRFHQGRHAPGVAAHR